MHKLEDAVHVIYWLCCLVFISTSVWAGPGDYFWNMIDGNFMIVQTYEPPPDESGHSKKYSIVKLTVRENNRIPLRVLPERGLLTSEAVNQSLNQALIKTYVPSFIGFVERFLYEQYAARGVADAPQEIAKERPFLDSPATWVVITDHNNLERIHAVFRVVQRDAFINAPDPDLAWHLAKDPKVGIGDENPALGAYLSSFEGDVRLDLENRLDFDLPKLPIRIDPQTGETHGGWAELKSLIVDPKSEEGFMKVLLYALSLHGQHALLQASRDIPFDQFSVSHGLSSLNYRRFYAADHLVLETIRPGLKRMYERLGFKVLKYFSEKNTWVMSIGTDDFVAKSVSKTSDLGIPFEDTIKSDGPWVPTVLLPPSSYDAFRKNRLNPPQIEFEDLSVTCRHLIGSLSTPFFNRGSTAVDIHWNIKEK